ncbi:MAG: type II toxin-antitoxin system RelE family toxin [Pseudonocardiaceae bacterium]
MGSKLSGNLTTFRKLVVGDRGYRIVYRVDPDGSVVVVWVIGRRSDDEV